MEVIRSRAASPSCLFPVCVGGFSNRCAPPILVAWKLFRLINMEIPTGESEQAAAETQLQQQGGGSHVTGGVTGKYKHRNYILRVS